MILGISKGLIGLPSPGLFVPEPDFPSRRITCLMRCSFQLEKGRTKYSKEREYDKQIIHQSNSVSSPHLSLVIGEGKYIILEL
jgi:hypothetical protein